MKAFTTGEICKHCGVAPRTVHGWIDRGILKGFRIPGSRHRRVLERDFLDFLKEHKIPNSLVSIEENEE
mgnify:FL=1